MCGGDVDDIRSWMSIVWFTVLSHFIGQSLVACFVYAGWRFGWNEQLCIVCGTHDDVSEDRSGIFLYEGRITSQQPTTKPKNLSIIDFLFTKKSFYIMRVWF